ncbi:MAG: glycoside hydrolase/phage tail family protein [Rhodobacteraceae bacterium]|uniref:baseplate multidomain protein megatron n=1 Tax=Albidovulum sp. TaxID=1872424 RepID=UPI001DC95DEB|nr:glycoside hydrolase TIM-barrel-like domain-containing protein [uncultured Defluviimonas sp.]MCB2124910.1 glycoside hydrolase/phage tail family protein [Paracoccaceae bacterium]MCC0070343.1 glycoside hydrolase/phage tail family protein [Paracoccaceae bacterium]
MATILLSAAGASIGAGFGGSILGLSGAVIGRAVGATFGRIIDQRLMGPGSQPVETGRIDRFRLTGASEGAPVGQIWGRMRVSGQVIWASRFLETATTSGGGGKGTPPTPKVTEYSYSVSLAVALCEGEITRVGRIWADGVEIGSDDVTLRVYTGSEDQLPDPKMEAIEGAGEVPAYRGIAYVVFEDLDLGAFGNRVPQFSFEVQRPAQGRQIDSVPDLVRGISGVALIPGTGEYTLATTPVHFSAGLGENVSANIHSPAGKTDFAVSLESLGEELPGCGSVSLVVSWFGDDLRCGACNLKPKVEDNATDGVGMPWRAGGIARAAADEVIRDAGRPVYGGTPADQSVVEAISALRTAGKHVVFYPFILMEQKAGNGLADPWTGNPYQPVLPWRGRITLSVAPGRPGTPDRTSAATAEVAAFFGTAQASDFAVSGTTVSYTGPAEWSYRRFVLHYAHLCAAAGGVDAFCVGSEMRGLTQIRTTGDSFPAVAALRALAAEVRAILGPATKIGYAADWSEYFGYQTPEGDLRYHLDPLWADPEIDFVGIDNYMPLSDWRDGQDHADAHWGSVYNIDYLKANIEGGEGYDWFYASPAERDAQRRTPITDGTYDEAWVWRVKDIRSWWENVHHDRIGGVKGAPSSWVPQSKPIWFTEFGCAAIDKGTNEPNKFLDPKSSESLLPSYSNGRRDDLIQMQYLRAMIDFWRDPARNPVSEEYGGSMVDMDRAHVWAWDARPFPQFPANTATWADGDNYARGHWITGRVSAQPLSSVVAEICGRSDVADIDVSGLYGLVRGYSVADIGTGRAALQPLMLGYGFEAVERDGKLRFRMRDGVSVAEIGSDALAVSEGTDGWVETSRATEAEMAGRVRLSYVEAEGDYEARAVEAIFPDEETRGVAQSELSLALTRSEGQRIVERWLAEARVSRDGARFALAPSLGHLGAGDVVTLEGGLYRIDRVEQAGALGIEAVRVEPAVYEPSDEAEERVTPRTFVAPAPVLPLFMDLPLMSGNEVPHQPHLAVSASPWPGSVAVYSSDTDAGYALKRILATRSVIGRTQTALSSAAPGIWDRGPALRVKVSGALDSVDPDRLLNGQNLMAIGDGSPANWELFQFADAVLVAPGSYDLTLRLRGQAGTDAAMPPVWPVGSHVVLMNGAPKQIEIGASERDLARHYRIGPSRRSYDDPSYVHLVEAFAGVGLRPLAPVHVSARRTAGGDLAMSWIRRTRVDGDSWSGVDVPVGETTEAYLLRVVQGASVLREVTLGQPGWTYPGGMQAADGAAPPFEIHVAQLSDSFGPGLFRRIVIDV